MVSISGEEKLASSSTWIRYEVAPTTEDQSKYGVVLGAMPPSEGMESDGIEGAATTSAVKELEPEKLSPYELLLTATGTE